MDMLVVCAIAAVLAAVLAAVSAALAWRALNEGRERDRQQDDVSAELERMNASLAVLQSALTQLGQQRASATAVEQQRYEALTAQLNHSVDRVDRMRQETVLQLGQNREAIDARLDQVRETVDRQLGAIRQDNAQQLEQVRLTVDEKLSRTLNDRLSLSFKQVSDQLEAVYRGLGDMQSIASGVGDLKRVLGNVKTRGILGEVQLGAILSDILTPDQYLENVITKPGSADRVEFAVKLPVEEGEPILLPIDAKFPGDAYEQLRDAVASGDAEAVAAARKQLESRVKQAAKDIFTKYVSVPETTNFGIMFLPFEGLYAEVVDIPGLLEALSRDYHVNVAGPSTMAAILNSLQMSYQTFRLQQRTDDVLQVLSAVKAELPKYQKALKTAYDQIDRAGRTVDSIMTTRTRAIERKLKVVDMMEDGVHAAQVLGIEELEVAASLDAVRDSDAREGADA